jgi:hypothetical protein
VDRWFVNESVNDRARGGRGMLGLFKLVLAAGFDLLVVLPGPTVMAAA